MSQSRTLRVSRLDGHYGIRTQQVDHVQQKMVREIVLLLLFYVIVTTVDSKSYTGYSVYRLAYNSSRQSKSLRRSLLDDQETDFWSQKEVMVSPRRQRSFLQNLRGRGIEWKVMIDDVERAIKVERRNQQKPVSNGRRAISYEKFLRFEEIQTYLSELNDGYPIVNVSRIGYSYENRELLIIKISSEGSQDYDSPRPIILIDAGIHSREWIAPALALFIIQQLVENDSNADLIENVDWHIIPLLNPDGYEFSHVEDRMWRKTRSVQSYCHGVDANRNFDVHWNEVGTSSDPCSEIYGGPKAFSEPETAALRDYVLGIRANIKLYLTLHSYGSYFLYSWGYTTSLPDNWEELDYLARKANEAQMAADGSRFSIGTAANMLYAAAGGSDDWMKAKAEVPLVYTIELPGGGYYGFDMPASRISKTVTQFWPAIRVFGEYVSTPSY